jgi:hypothetical protein
MVTYCCGSCSECHRLECGPTTGLSWVLRLFFSPPSKSTEAVLTCVCSGGARFKSLPVEWLYSSPSAALIDQNPLKPPYITDIFLHRTYFGVYLHQISHPEGGARSSETSSRILTTPQDTVTWTITTLKSCFCDILRNYRLVPWVTLHPFLFYVTTG